MILHIKRELFSCTMLYGILGNLRYDAKSDLFVFIELDYDTLNTSAKAYRII